MHRNMQKTETDQKLNLDGAFGGDCLVCDGLSLPRPKVKGSRGSHQSRLDLQSYQFQWGG